MDAQKDKKKQKISKKGWLIIIGSIVISILILVGTMYKIDMDRMKHNYDVVFSTWGRDYKPAEIVIENEEKGGIGIRIEIESKVIAVSSYSNYAWSAQYKGVAILNDGSIYKWDEKDSEKLGNYKLGTIEGVQDFILNEGNKKITKVSDDDLTQIKDYINKIENDIEVNYVGADMGTEQILVINNNNEEIILKSTGDAMGENKSENAQTLLGILEKYLK